jgi:hypothetical protein
MTKQRYEALVDALCVEAGISNPASMYAAAHLRVKDVDFSMYHCGDKSPDQAIVYANFGRLPTQGREMALLRLLETNLFLFAPDSPSFSCHPDTENVMLSALIPLPQATAASVLDLLAGFADTALQWRQSFFLTDAEQLGFLGKDIRKDANSTAAKLARFGARAN